MLFNSSAPGPATFTVPATGTYLISVSGAQGSPGGLGATVAGDLVLTAGTVLQLGVGGKG